MYFSPIMLPQWQTGTVKQIEMVSPNTAIFTVALSQPFEFLPGQFVTLDLPIHEQRNKRWRSYSIANMPTPGCDLQLAITFLENGLASTYLQEQVTIGSTFQLRGPQGVFILPQQRSKKLFFICTGTGIAPFRSMLQTIVDQKLPFDEIHLVCGARTSEFLLFADEMRALDTLLPHFHYHPTLSRQDWDGHKGYVHPVYESLIANHPDAFFMLCGWKPMVDEAKQRILQHGYTTKDVQIELYG